MPKYRITGPDGSTYEVNAPDNASESDVLAYAQKNFKLAAQPNPEKGFGAQLTDSINDVPRQLGLTGRYAMEGVGNVANLLTAPIRGVLNAALPEKKGLGEVIAGKPGRPAIAPMDFSGMADSLGLPKPQTATERVVGDATRAVAGSLVPIGIGAGMSGASNSVANGVGRTLAANPGTQLLSAGASGLAGGYTRETGGDDKAQLMASLAAGIATPFAVNAASSFASRAGDAARRLVNPPAPAVHQIDITINNALSPSGMSLADLPADVLQGMRNDVKKAMQIGGDLSPDAVRRLTDYRLVGATPTRAGLTLDPADVTQQRNLAKLGANSKDKAAQALALTQNANNRQLVTGLNGLGAGSADDVYAGGLRIMDALSQRNGRAKQIIDQLYANARDANGRSAALDPSAFTQRANNLLDDALLGGKLPGDVRNLLNKAATGEMPLTVDVAEQFKTRIGDLQRASSDAAERKALGLVRSALDDTPLLPGQEIGQDAMAAFGKARGMNRAWMNIVDKTPALQAVRDGIEPDKFVQHFIVGGGGKSNVMDVAMLKNSIKASPEAMDAVKGQITSFLKQRALNGAADEVGNFSQSAYNKALQAIGERKLALFFSKDEISQLKAIGRVASYEQVQPVGSAVNNSNTAPALMGTLLDRIGGSTMLSKVPFGRVIQEPAQNISIGMQAERVLDPAQALTNGITQSQPLLPRLSPQMLPAPGLFLVNGADRKEKR